MILIRIVNVLKNKIDERKIKIAKTRIEGED